MRDTLASSVDLSVGLGAIIGQVPPHLLFRTMTGLPGPPGRSHQDSVPQDSAESSFDLLLLAKEGDARALERLCARYLPRLKRWAHGRLPPSSRGMLDTEDLAQEVLITLFDESIPSNPSTKELFKGTFGRRC